MRPITTWMGAATLTKTVMMMLTWFLTWTIGAIAPYSALSSMNLVVQHTNGTKMETVSWTMRTNARERPQDLRSMDSAVPTWIPTGSLPTLTSVRTQINIHVGPSIQMAATFCKSPLIGTLGLILQNDLASSEISLFKPNQGIG